MSKVKTNIPKNNYDAVFPTRLRLLLDSRARDGEKLTQEKLAERIGVTRQSVGQWKDGITTPSIEALKRIAEEYIVSTDYLLGLSDVPTVETNLRQTCELTGLSSGELEELTRSNNDHAKSTITQLLEGESFYKLIISILRYKRARYRQLTRERRKALSFIKHKGLKIDTETVYHYGEGCIPDKEKGNFLKFVPAKDDGDDEIAADPAQELKYAIFDMQESIKELAEESTPSILKDVIADMRSNTYQEDYGLAKKGEQPHGNDNKAR